jgi:hypothetical protein
MVTAGLALSGLALVLASLLMLATSMSRATGIVVAVGAFVVESLAATVLPLEGASAWMVTAGYVGMAVAFGAWIVALVRSDPGGPDDDPGNGFGGGGGGPPRDPSTPPDDPPWWPEFERDLREYARDRSLTPG